MYMYVTSMDLFGLYLMSVELWEELSIQEELIMSTCLCYYSKKKNVCLL